MNKTELHKEHHNERVSDLQIGIFVLVAIVLLMSTWIWLRRVPFFDPVERLTITFHEVDGLNLNGAVRLHGVYVGTVDQIYIDGDLVKVDVEVKKSRAKIPVGTQFHIFSFGLVGAKYIDVVLPIRKSPLEKLALLPENAVVAGIDPLPTELVMDRIVKSLNRTNIDTLVALTERDLRKLDSTADNINRLSGKFGGVADHTQVLEDKIAVLTDNMRVTSSKLNRLLGDPSLPEDIRKTAESVQLTMHELNKTLTDQNLRQDIRETMANLNASTHNINSAISQVSGNVKFRSDMKDILSRTNDIVTKLDDMMSKPTANPELKGTLTQTRDAVEHIDLAARQMNQMLDQKRPLLKMLFGRPGHLAGTQSASSTDTH